MRAFDELWALVGNLEAMARLALAKSSGTASSVSGTGFWKSISGALQPAASIGQPGQIPATNSVGSDVTWIATLGPWVTISVGSSPGSFTPGNSQTALLVDTGGGQVTIKTPTNPYDGQNLVIYDYEGTAATNPILIVASPGQAIEDPAVPGSDPAASGRIAMQGMTAWWKFFAGTNQWELLFVSTPFTAAPNSWMQPTWFIDPVGGSDQNQGTTRAKPLKTKLELSRRYGGTWTPTFSGGVDVVVTYIKPDTIDGDPALFDPVLTEDATFTQISDLPAAGFTGTLGVVTAKNLAANQALRSTFVTTTGAIAAGMMLVNATRGGSRAFVQRNTAGSTWQITQPLAAYVAGTNPSATNVDTWATGDAITGYMLQNVNIPRVGGQLADLDAPFDAGHYIRQLNIWDPDNGGVSPCNIDANIAPRFVECSSGRLCTIGGTGQAEFATFLNFFTTSDFFAGTNNDNGILIAGGAYVSPSGGAFFRGATIDNCTIFSSSAPVGLDTGNIGQVFLDTGTAFWAFGNCALINAEGVLFGPGTLNVQTGTVSYSGENAVTAFPLSGGLQIRGLSTAYSNATSGGVVAVHKLALTAAALDAAAGAAGFGGLAYAGAACITNGSQP